MSIRWVNVYRHIAIVDGMRITVDFIPGKNDTAHHIWRVKNAGGVVIGEGRQRSLRAARRESVAIARTLAQAISRDGGGRGLRKAVGPVCAGGGEEEGEGMKLTIRHSGDDWYVIERAEHDGRVWTEQTGPNAFAFRCSSRFSDADVEGDGAQMLSIADAIERRGSVSHKRCAVRVEGADVLFKSPRNSTMWGDCSLAEADDLAAQIREMIGGDRGLREEGCGADRR
jgi:hypothetical protein